MQLNLCNLLYNYIINNERMREIQLIIIVDRTMTQLTAYNIIHKKKYQGMCCIQVVAYKSVRREKQTIRNT